MIPPAEQLTPPSFAADLDVAIHEGARPAELDALMWFRPRLHAWC